MADEQISGNARYQPQGEIARGGMGVVYKVHDCDLDRTLAMKRMMSAPDLDGGEVEVDRFARFMEEAHVTAQLDHPGIVPVFDLGTDDDGCAWYTMRMVRGQELGEVIRLARDERDHWNLSRLVGVLVRVCQAMAHAHGKGVIHRDLKPSNIMVGDLGEVYVMDWGLAKQLGREDVHNIRLKLGDEMARSGMETVISPRAAGASSDSSLDAPLMTMDGAVVGTPAYMPPEQAAGIVDQVDHLSDIYALGAILYEVLAKSPPYRDTGATVARDVITALSNGPPTPVRTLRADAAVELAAICEKAMSRIREDRYQTSLELAEDLQAYLDGRVVKAHQTGAVAEFKKWVLRNKGTAVASALVALSLVALAIFQTYAKAELAASLEKEEEARKEAQRTLSDSYVTFGLLEAEKMEYARAKLWFNEAAKLSGGDPDRLRANRMRASSFGAFAPVPLRVLELPIEQWKPDEFHPKMPFVVIQLEGAGKLVADMERQVFLPPPDGKGQFLAAGFDPVSNRVAVSSAPGKVNIRNLPDGELLREFDFGREVGEIRNLTWSGDGSLLFIGSEPGRIFDLESETLWPSLLKLDRDDVGDPIGFARFSPSGDYLSTTTRKEKFEIFRLDRRAGVAAPVAVDLPVRIHTGWTAPEFFGGGKWVRIDLRSEIAVYELPSGKQVTRFPAGKDPPDGIPVPVADAFKRAPVLKQHLNRNLTVSRDQKSYYNLYPHRFISEYGLERPTPSYVGEIRGIFAYGTEPLAVVRKQEFLSLWRIPEDRRHWVMPCSALADPVFSGDGRLVAAAGKNQPDFQVFDVRGRQPAGAKIVPGGIVRCADFSLENGAVAVLGIHPGEGGGTSSRVEFWDWQKGARLGGPVALPSPPLAVRCHKGGEWAAVACEGGEVFRIEIGDGKWIELFKAEHPLDTLVFADTRTGEVLIAAHEILVRPHRTFVWDIAAGAFKFPPLEHVSHGYEKPISVRDGILITPNGDHTFCDLATGEALESKIAEIAGDNHLAFGNDPGTVLTSARTTAAKVLDWRKGETVCPDLVHGFRDSRWVHRTLAVPGTPWIVICGMNGARFFDTGSGKVVAPPIEWTESPNLWPFPPCEMSPDGKAIAFNGGPPGMHLIDLSFLFAEPGEADQDYDELAAGARVAGGGLTEMNYVTGWPKLLRAYLEEHRGEQKMRIE